MPKLACQIGLRPELTLTTPGAPQFFFKQNKPYKLNVLSHLNTLHDGLLNLQKSSRKRTNLISGAEEVWRLDWRGQGSRYQTGAPSTCVSTIKGKSELQARRRHS